MRIISFLKKLFSIMDNSKKKFHLIPLTIFLVFSVLYHCSNLTLDPVQTSTLVTTLGIITTFFFFSVEKLNLDSFESKLPTNEPYFSFLRMKRVSHTQGHLYRNTVFSLLIINVLLLFVIFFMYFFALAPDYVLIASTSYLLSGFYYIIALWNLGL